MRLVVAAHGGEFVLWEGNRQRPDLVVAGEEVAEAAGGVAEGGQGRRGQWGDAAIVAVVGREQRRHGVILARAREARDGRVPPIGPDHDRRAGGEGRVGAARIAAHAADGLVCIA